MLWAVWVGGCARIEIAAFSSSSSEMSSLSYVASNPELNKISWRT